MREAGDYTDEKTATEALPQWSDFREGSQKVGVVFSDFPRRGEEVGRFADIPAEWAEEVTKKGYPGFEFVKPGRILPPSWGINGPGDGGLRNSLYPRAVRKERTRQWGEDVPIAWHAPGEG